MKKISPTLVMVVLFVVLSIVSICFPESNGIMSIVLFSFSFIVVAFIIFSYFYLKKEKESEKYDQGDSYYIVYLILHHQLKHKGCLYQPMDGSCRFLPEGSKYFDDTCMDINIIKSKQPSIFRGVTLYDIVVKHKGREVYFNEISKNNLNYVSNRIINNL